VTDAVELQLADLTTFRVGGPAKKLITAQTEAEMIDAVLAAGGGG